MRVAGMSFSDFQSNETIVKAVFYDFLIIGEAAINIPSEIQQRYPNIPWRVIGDMRNVMAHKYFQVNLRIFEVGFKIILLNSIYSYKI
ncbi:hypothetical protein NIES4071_54750 [Calothrix sp. NIES-4071]|nr:hypothetical protein NIES4071_54750 [Calothrix sp. NIES-4071]BAZ59783.1 hypothetical protein NIES4105_54700 [Calothrix sp. NIES-4105]